jgi:hypothetical protein
MSEPERRDERTDEDRGEDAARGLRIEQQDDALDRLVEKEIRDRMQSAFDDCIALGFAAHLVGVMRRRGGVEYSLALYPNGAPAVDIRDVQEIADRFRLDHRAEKSADLDGWLIVLSPRR